jgi:hypothetical protein
MKSSVLILAIWLASSAWADTLPPKQQMNPPAAAQPSGAPARPLTGSSPMHPAPASRAGNAIFAAPQSAKAQPVNNQGKPSPGSAKDSAALSSGGRHGREQRGAPRSSSRRSATSVAKTGHKGPRDPFVSPIVERFRGTAACTGSGRQCLEVGDVSLHGVVHSPSGFIAVVMNGDHTYFLRENDPLADGTVARITSDAITFRQRSADAFGRPLVREVIKKLGVPAA